MQILPVVIATNKESYSNFFVHLITLYLRSNTLRFAVVDQDITFAGNVYTAFPVRIGAVKSTIDSKRDDIEITLSDVTNAFKVAVLRGEDFRGSVMEILRISYPESLTDATQYQGVFRGELDAPKLDDGKSEFSCVARDIMSNYETGRTLMLSCNNVFGDADCGYAPESHSSTASPTSTVLTVTFTGSPHPINRWKYGFITVDSQTVSIISSGANSVTLEYPLYSSPVGKVFTLKSGCNNSFKWCKEHYYNHGNYSGFPAIPWENSMKS